MNRKSCLSLPNYELLVAESLKGLVGERNARRGSVKFFEAMQDVRLNKQLFYVSTKLMARMFSP